MGKVTKEQFLQAIVNNDDNLNNLQLAAKLGISEQYFYELRDKYSTNIRQFVKKSVRSMLPEQVRNLQKNAKSGDTSAAKYLIELDNQFHLEDTLDTIMKEISELKAQGQIEEKIIEDADFKELNE